MSCAPKSTAYKPRTTNSASRQRIGRVAILRHGHRAPGRGGRGAQTVSGCLNSTFLNISQHFRVICSGHGYRVRQGRGRLPVRRQPHDRQSEQAPLAEAIQRPCRLRLVLQSVPGPQGLAHDRSTLALECSTVEPHSLLSAGTRRVVARCVIRARSPRIQAAFPCGRCSP